MSYYAHRKSYPANYISPHHQHDTNASQNFNQSVQNGYRAVTHEKITTDELKNHYEFLWRFRETFLVKTCFKKRVLELGCGKGQNINGYINASIESLHAIDITNTQIKAFQLNIDIIKLTITFIDHLCELHNTSIAENAKIINIFRALKQCNKKILELCNHSVSQRRRELEKTLRRCYNVTLDTQHSLTQIIKLLDDDTDDIPVDTQTVLEHQMWDILSQAPPFNMNMDHWTLEEKDVFSVPGTIAKTATNVKFGVVVSMLSIHFAARTDDVKVSSAIDNVIRVLNEIYQVLEAGGSFVGLVPDGNVLANLARENKREIIRSIKLDPKKPEDVPSYVSYLHQQSCRIYETIQKHSQASEIKEWRTVRVSSETPGVYEFVFPHPNPKKSAKKYIQISDSAQDTDAAFEVVTGTITQVKVGKLSKTEKCLEPVLLFSDFVFLAEQIGFVLKESRLLHDYSESDYLLDAQDDQTWNNVSELQTNSEKNFQNLYRTFVFKKWSPSNS